MIADDRDEQILQLQERIRVLERMIDTLPDRLFIKDRESRFLYANKAVIEAHQLESRDALIGTMDFDHQAEAQASQFFADEQRMMESGESLIDNEELNYDQDGNIIWFATNKILFHDEQGNVAGFVGLARDVTRLKQAEQELEERQRVIQNQKDILREVSTPIIPLFDGVLIMPLIGSIDTARARDIMRNLLAGISEHRAKTVIVDITGVPVVDSGVADHLNKTIQAARLKGATTIVSGISDAVAETIVDLGIDWSDMETVRDLQSGLSLAMERAGLRLDND